MPQVISKILEINEDELDIGINQIESIISSDPNLVSKILKLANSPFYSRSNNITDINRALTLLGFKSIKSITLLVSVSTLLPNLSQNTSAQRKLWMDSIIIAVTGKTIAAKTGNNKIQEKVFLAGLLRHIGQLILYSRFPSSYDGILAQTTGGMDLEKLQGQEKEIFGITTPELTKFAMEKWNFPKEFENTAEITSYSPGEVNQKAGIIGLIVCMSELLLYIKNLGTEKNNPELKDKLSQSLEEYFSFMNIPEKTVNFIKNDLQNTFKQNEFYAFCEELFAL